MANISSVLHADTLTILIQTPRSILEDRCGVASSLVERSILHRLLREGRADDDSDRRTSRPLERVPAIVIVMSSSCPVRLILSGMS